MAIASGSRHRLAAIAEATYGTTPATPAFTSLRHNSCNIGLSKDAVESEEIRGDRQTTSFRHGNKSVGGDIEGELVYGEYDSLIESALCGTWTPKATKTGTTISAASADNSFNDSANGFVAAGFQVGDKFTTTGFATSANNSSWVVATVTAGKITVTPTGVIVTEAAGASVTVTSKQSSVKAGTTRRSFSIERTFQDITQYMRYTGCETNTMSISIAPNSMVGMGFGFIGKDQSIAQTAITGATYSTLSSAGQFDSFTATISEGGTAIALVTEMEVTLDNGIEPQFVVGSSTTLRPSIGRCDVTGSITVYLEDQAMLTKFQNETESSLDVTLTDPAGNTFRLKIPKLKYNSGQPDVSGEGSVTVSMDFQAIYDSVDASNIVITRNPI